MLSIHTAQNQTFPLIHEVHTDDQHLLNTVEGAWFEILYNFPWELYRTHAANYYNALYGFNQGSGSAEESSESDKTPVPTESKEEARLRLLSERTTMLDEPTSAQQMLHNSEPIRYKVPEVLPEETSPGVVPVRQAGRQPKCFFGMLKATLGCSLLGYSPEPEQIHRLLTSNPSFARVCGFALTDKNRNSYQQNRIPSLRKLEQFDQVMRQSGIWDEIKVSTVTANLESGAIKIEQELVGDTTHYHAHSGFETVIYEDEKGAENKKSQSKPTKRCSCGHKSWESCEHPWELADEGAGTVVKSSNKMYWAHKSSVIGFPGAGVALDAVAVCDAASNDGKTFLPHVKLIFEKYPNLSQSIKRALYDSACDDAVLKKQFREEFGVELKASQNPRRKKPVTNPSLLPRGMEKITPYGVPHCVAGYEMEYKGARYENETFIYSGPRDEEGTSICLDCSERARCCNKNSQGERVITVPFTILPHIDANDPPMAKRFKAIMKRRPSVERMIKRLKCDLGDDRLGKQGNESFQAYLDKTMIAYHLLICHLH